MELNFQLFDMWEETEYEPISNKCYVEDVPTRWALEEVGWDPFQVVQVQALRLKIITS